MQYRYRCPDHGDFDKDYEMGNAPANTGCPVCARTAARVLVMPHVSSAATPVRTETRRSEGAGSAPATPRNSWERGIATDERGMPFLGKGMAPIGVKEYGERRTEIDEHRRRLRNQPVPSPLHKEGATP